MNRFSVQGRTRFALCFGVSTLVGMVAVATAQEQPANHPEAPISSPNSSANSSPVSPATSMKSTGMPFAGTCYARSVVLVVDEHGGGSAPIVTAREQTTLVSLEEGLEFEYGAISHPHFTFKRVGRDLVIAPKKRTRDGTISNVIVRTTKLPLSLRLSVTAKAKESTDLVYVTTRSRPAMCEQELRAPLARLVEVEDENTELRGKLARMQEQCKVNNRMADLRESLRRHHYSTLYPIPETSSSTEPVSAQLVRAEIRPDGRGKMIFFNLANRHSEPFQLANMLASNHETEDRHVQLALLDLPPPEQNDDELIASVPPKTTARGVLVLPFDLHDSSQPLRLVFKSAGGGSAIAAATDRWVMRPMTDEEYEQDEWEKEQAEKLAKRYSQHSLNLRGVAGIVWIGDGVGDSQLDATSLYGFAARFQRGFDNRLALEGQLMGAWTGNAIFEDVAVDDVMGQLTRRGTLGRAEVGGAVRLGYEYIFTARAALAVQLARFEADLVPEGGGATSALDSTFELAALLTFGAGVHTHLSEGVVAGLILSADTPFAASVDDKYRRAIKAGVYMGYGWSPAPKKRPTTSAQ